jgi:hypothetical protein
MAVTSIQPNRSIMATKEEKKKVMKKLASKGVKAGSKPLSGRAQYLKYGDFDPSDVHEGSTTYGGTTYTDSPLTNRNSFATSVTRSGDGKKAFILQGKLYKFTNPDRTSGSATHAEVTK